MVKKEANTSNKIDPSGGVKDLMELQARLKAAHEANTRYVILSHRHKTVVRNSTVSGG